MRKTTPQEEHEGEELRIHTQAITALMITPVTHGMNLIIKLTEPSPSSDFHDQEGHLQTNRSQ